MMPNQPVPAPSALTYADRLEVSETFVDTLEKFLVDGPIVRMEFVVNRLDAPKPQQPLSGKKITAARLVMSLQSFLALASQINGMMQGLHQQGVVQIVSPTPQRPLN